MNEWLAIAGSVVFIGSAVLFGLIQLAALALVIYIVGDQLVGMIVGAARAIARASEERQP